MMGAKSVKMILPRFSSSTAGGSEVGSIRRIYTGLFVLVFIWHMSGISYTRYLLLCFIRIGRMIWSVHSCQCANIKLLSNFPSFRFCLIGSTCRNRFIGFWLYTPFRVLHMVLLLTVFYSRSLAYCLRLLRSNPKSCCHYAVFTPCEGIPLSTIYPTSPRGVDCAVLFVCLLFFRGYD